MRLIDKVIVVLFARLLVLLQNTLLYILLENELGTFALVKVASMQWGTLVKT